MRLVTYNIHYGEGKDGRTDLARIAETVRGAEVIALQEVERNYWPGGQPDQAAAIEALLPEYHWAYVPAFDVDDSEMRPDGTVLNRRRQHGVMILSRTPILSCRPIIFPKVPSADDFSMQMGALEGVIVTGLGPLRVYSVHLGHLDSAERQHQVAQLLCVVHSAPGQGGAWTGPNSHPGRDWAGGKAMPPMPEDAVLLGDFNMEPDSPEYARLTGERDPSGDAVFMDAWPAANNGAEPGFTQGWPPDGRDGAGRRIDYCFLGGGLRHKLRACWVDDAAAGSDHRPVWTELGADPSAPEREFGN